MATEGTFSGNADSAPIDQIMISGFTGMVNAITEQSKVVTKLNDNLSKYITDSETRYKEDLKATKSIASRITKEYNLIQKETNPLLVSMVEAIKGMSNARSTPITKTSSTGDTQVIIWEESQFDEFIGLLKNPVNNTEGSINSMESLFSTIISGMSSMQNTDGSGFLTSLFAPSFESRAKKFTKAYQTVIDGIVSSMVKMEKNSDKFQKSSDMFIKTITSINNVSKDMVAAQKFKALAGSIAMLGLSLVAFAAVSPAVLVVVGALSMLKGLTFAMAQGMSKDILKISAAIALFGLTIWGLSEIVTPEALLKTGAAILLLGFAIKGFSMAIGNGMGRNGLKTLLLTTVAVAALGIALWTFNDVKWESMAKGAAALTGMAAAMWAVSKVPDAAIGAASLLLGAAALGAIGLALQVFPDDTDMLLPVGLFVLGFGTTLALAGTVAPLIAAGAAVMLIGGVALVAIAAGLAIINSTSFDKTRIVDFTESLKYMFLNIGTLEMAKAGAIAVVAITPMFIATTMASLMALQLSLISNLSYDPQGAMRLGETALAFFSVIGTKSMLINATIAAVAAVPMLAAATMGTVIGLELALLSNLTYDPVKIGEFGTAMSTLTQTYVDTASSIGFIGAAKFIGGIGLATTMAVATPLVAFALVTSSLAAKAINPENIDKFGTSISSLIGAYQKNSVSVFAMPKLLANVALISGIAGSTINIGQAISEFIKISDKPEVIDRAVDGVANFVSRMISVLSEKGEELKNIPEEAQRVLGIGNLMKDVADGMRAMGNMEYYETKLVNGQIVKVGQAKKFTQADFDRVGTSLSAMITPISKTLSEIGSDGGWFSSNKTKKGIEALSQIGSVFTPIVDIISSFRGGNKDITNADVTDITGSIRTLLIGISSTFQDMDKADTLKYFESKSDVMLGLRDTLKYLSGMSGDGLSKTSMEISKIFDTIGNEKPMVNLTKNLSNIRKEATMIRAEVNKFDLQRLTLFNQTTKNLLEAAKNGSMEQLIHAMNDLVNELRTAKTTVSQAPTETSAPFSILNPVPAANGAPVKQNTLLKPTDNKSTNDILEDKLNGMIEMLSKELKSINNKFQNPMPVKITGTQPTF